MMTPTTPQSMVAITVAITMGTTVASTVAIMVACLGAFSTDES
jgi:hypothetical protein